jgi:hypothetical protein
VQVSSYHLPTILRRHREHVESLSGIRSAPETVRAVHQGDLSEDEYLDRLANDIEFEIDSDNHISDDVANLIRCMARKDWGERLCSLKQLVGDLAMSYLYSIVHSSIHTVHQLEDKRKILQPNHRRLLQAHEAHIHLLIREARVQIR